MEREFDPDGGDLGRGIKVDAPPAEVYGYMRYRPTEGEQYRLPVYGSDGLPTGWMWEGWVRFSEDGKKGWCIAFESKATPEEKKHLLDIPHYAASGGRVCMVRDFVPNPEEWLASLS